MNTIELRDAKNVGDLLVGDYVTLGNGKKIVVTSKDTQRHWNARYLQGLLDAGAVFKRIVEAPKCPAVPLGYEVKYVTDLMRSDIKEGTLIHMIAPDRWVKVLDLKFVTKIKRGWIAEPIFPEIPKGFRLGDYEKDKDTKFEAYSIWNPTMIGWDTASAPNQPQWLINDYVYIVREFPNPKDYVADKNFKPYIMQSEDLPNYVRKILGCTENRRVRLEVVK